MKTTSTELVYASRLLYEHPYIVIFDKTGNDTLHKIQHKNPELATNERSCIYDIGAGEFDVKVNTVLEIIFDADDIDNYVEAPVIIKDVFALGYKSIGEVPSTWSVCALLEFPNGIPAILSGLEQKKRYYISSKKMWSDLMALYR